MTESKYGNPLDSLTWPQQYDNIYRRSEFSRRRVMANPDLGDKSDNYLGMQGYTTLEDLISRLEELAPGVSPSEVLINFWQLRWTSDATPAEIAERAERKRRSAEHGEKWERDTLSRLYEKYGAPEATLKAEQ